MRDGTPCGVTARIRLSEQPVAPRPTAALLSCPLIWALRFRSSGHLHFSFIAVKAIRLDARMRSPAKHSRSGTPCTLPRSSTAWSGCSQAAFEPSRRMSLSDFRGSITGIRARSSSAGRRQDIVLPVSLDCTIPLPLARTSLCVSGRHPDSSGDVHAHDLARLSRAIFAASRVAMSCSDASGSPT